MNVVMLVLTEMAAVAVVSAVLMLALYGPYSRAILASAHWATAKPRNLAVFLGAIVALPAALMLA